MTEAERVYEETLQALRDSQRSPDEMAEAEAVLRPLRDARARAESPALAAVAQRALGAARSARDARSGMACDLALDLLRLTLDDARALLDERP